MPRGVGFGEGCRVWRGGGFGEGGWIWLGVLDWARGVGFGEVGGIWRGCADLPWGFWFGEVCWIDLGGTDVLLVLRVGEEGLLSCGVGLEQGGLMCGVLCLVNRRPTSSIRAKALCP